MSIPTVTTAQATQAASTVDATPRHGRRAMMDAAAKALGMSAQDMRSALRQGQSLDDLAAAKGVSHDALVGAMKAAAPKGLTSAADADARIDAIASRKHTERPDGPSASSAATGTTSADGASGPARAERHHHHRHGAASEAQRPSSGSTTFDGVAQKGLVVDTTA